MGSYGEVLINDNRMRLIDLAGLSFDLKIMNGLFIIKKYINIHSTKIPEVWNQY